MIQEFATQRAEDAAHKYPLAKHMKEDPRLRGVPLFLQFQNRRPLTPAQQARWDARAHAAGADAHRSDFRKPKGMSWGEFDAMQARLAAEKHAASLARVAVLKEKYGDRVKVRPPRPPRADQYAPGAKIAVVAKKNPYRPGTVGHAVFDKYRGGVTVREFEQAAASLTGKRRPIDMLRYDARKGHIKVEETKP